MSAQHFHKKRNSSLTASVLSPEPPGPHRLVNSKENIEVLGEIREEPLRNIFISAIPPKLKATISQNLERNETARRSSSFARMRAKAFNINFFEYYKQKKEFNLLSREEREALIEDLYEFDKCFYLNQLKVQIHKAEEQKRKLSSGEETDSGLSIRPLGTAKGEDGEHELQRLGV